jgi:nicotinamidase-related amidase
LVASASTRSKTSDRRASAGGVKRLAAGRCFGAIIDVQEFFLSQVGGRLARSRIESNVANLVRLLGYFRIPLVVTLERPVHYKGALPKSIKRHLDDGAGLFEKDFFDLTKEKKIRDYLKRLKKDQVVVAGSETDVCVLQSVLGLLELGYEVFVVEDLLFSSTTKVEAAIARMQAAGAVFLTYKTLYFELVEAVEGRDEDRLTATFGPFPEDLPEFAA